MNDLTSFIFGTVRESEWHDMNSEIMFNIITAAQKAKLKGAELVVAGYLDKIMIDKLNSVKIKCIIHYSSMPTIFLKPIEFPKHLQQVKTKSKEHQKIVLK
ncbi:MAG: hypothetical protein ACRCV7_00350 [Culicoidibacterales bacterium]